MTNMKFLSPLIFLFLHIIGVSSSSPCEELQNIQRIIQTSYANKNIKLDCEGKNPIFYTQSNMFLVEDFSFQNTSFRLVVSSYSTTGTGHHCHLPNQTISYWDSDLYPFLGYDFNFSIISFVNCTQKIENPSYELIPCLNRTASRVYAMTLSRHSYFVSNLHDSCSLVGQAITDYIDEPLGHVGYETIMQAIEKGVLVNWTNITPGLSIEECLKWSLWPFQVFKGEKLSEVLLQSLRPASFLPLLLSKVSVFLGCIYYSSHDGNIFILVLIVLFGIILITLFTRIILAPLAVCSFLAHKWWRMSSSVSSIEKFLRKNELLQIRRYDFIEIYIITNHFREKVGQGGFGSVYKGKLLSGQQVAVKILSSPVGDGDDFISEVATIGRIHHTNIVHLIGFCSEGSKRALIYSYMPNGSLDKYIFSSNNISLSMEKRREIAIGIARGIDYLHRGCAMQILHFDIKPHNILLDRNLVPKISDFGLARLYPRDYSLVTLSMARGTIGYIAPELISRTFGAVSYKADVYSFGMLLMEMVSERRNVNNHVESSGQVYYPSWIYDQLNLPAEAHYLSSNVPKFGEIEERLYKVALWCIQMKASNRPTMGRVMEMLQNDANSLEMPPRPSMICTPHEFSVRPSGSESCSVELSLISEEISML